VANCITTHEFTHSLSSLSLSLSKTHTQLALGGDVLVLAGEVYFTGCFFFACELVG
jgi:hypothetical protein